MTHDELNAALVIQRRIDRLQASLDTLRETGGVGCSLGGEPVSGGTGRDVGQLAIELEEEVKLLSKDRFRAQTIVQWELDKLELETLHRRLLELRYVRCLSWRMVRTALGYSERRIFQLHKEAKKITALCS